MCPFPKLRRTPVASRRALTLLELLIATSIMTIMAGVLGALALSVQMHSEHSQGQGEAVQHARVVLDRIQRTLNEATASEDFPGFAVFGDTVAGYTFPDVLVAWSPIGAPADADGLPRWNEIVVFCPDKSAPNRLLEIRIPGDTRTVPALTDLTTWRSELLSVRQSNTVEKVELTDLVRTASTGSGLGAQTRAAVRFDVQQRPSSVDWQDFKSGGIDWEDLPWVQGIFGSQTGLRQVWCRIELQLTAGSDSEQVAMSGQHALTFFGSAAIYHEMQR
jgi:hypothetical protein